MRRISLLSIAIVAMLLACCQNDNTNIVGKDSSATFSLSIADTRTSLGESNGSKYPVYWSEDDCIAVNGVQSESITIAEDKSRAVFELSTEVSAPYAITYPYTVTTTAATPTVVFPAEQSYTEGSFGANCAPMCGYAEEGQSVVLNHLATILRLPIKGTADNTVLEKVVVTSSTAKLAGEFSVDCQNGTITPTNEATSSITYTVNQALSTSTETVLYISLPAVNAGSCTLEFFDSKGGKMSGNWSAETLKRGIIKEFECIKYSTGTTLTLTPFRSESDELSYERDAFGHVKDSAGNPIEGVAVSDGFTIVTTNQDGYYKMRASTDTWYIYITIPAEYEIPINEHGQPCFYQKYNEDSDQYDFTLTPLPNGKEDVFALFAFGDGHISSVSRYRRFKNETIPAIKNHSTELTTKGIPCYGITLGDVVSNSDKADTNSWRDNVRDGYDVSNTGLPVFQVMGNHDNTFCNTSKPLTTDSRTSTYELAAQREHEDMFGPVNYSFDRGNAHIIGMRNIIYRTNTSGSGYTYGFLPEQIEWLKQDLALVPKDKMVVLCMHIQVLYRTANHFSEMLALINQFNEAHIISGHTHINRNYEHALEGKPNTKVYEHNSACISGAAWSSNLCGDGVPMGYQVFIGGNNSTGGAFTDWYYMGCNEGINTRSHQMRLYRGGKGTPMGINTPTNDTSGVKGYYSFNYGDDYIIANVFNADKRWQIKVYEDDEYQGDMTLITTSGPDFSDLIGSYTKADPRRVQDGVESMHDMYVASLNLGVLGRYSESGGTGLWAWSNCYHLYKYKLKNSASKIKVVAVDRFGHEYTETYFTTGTTEDYNLVKTPN